MLEEDWLACEDAQQMLHHRPVRSAIRKLRLFTVASWRCVWDQLAMAERAAVEQAEQFADKRAHIAALGLRRAHADAGDARAAAFGAVTRSLVSRKRLAELLRDIFGNPFHRAVLDPAWRTPAAVALARSMYEERFFEEMPLLGDALEEAGCTDDAILSHCRESGPHVRGCWVVDLVLART